LRSNLDCDAEIVSAKRTQFRFTRIAFSMVRLRGMLDTVVREILAITVRNVEITNK
jgi:hypothetical protein